MKYYIADTHFGHENIIRLCSRPFETAAEMDRHMLAAWQRTVRPEDEVYIVGDFSFRSRQPTAGILEQLPGRKILLRGNHDRWVKVEPAAVQQLEAVHDLLMIEDTAPDPGTGVPRSFSVVLCHYPLLEWPQYHRGSLHVYGHVHNSKGHVYAALRRPFYPEEPGPHPRALNAGADICGFRPVTLAELMDINRRWYADGESAEIVSR